MNLRRDLDSFSFSLFGIFISLFYVYECLPKFMSALCAYRQSPRRAEEGVRFPRTRARDGCEP